MSEDLRSVKDRVRDSWQQRVTADPNTQPKLLLNQAGEFHRELKIQTRENQWRFLASIYPAIKKIAQSERRFEELIQDEYFSKSSRKKPKFEDSFQQVMCFAVRAQTETARELAQRRGCTFKMFAQQGVRGREFYSTLKRYGGPSGAHKAAKEFFGRGKNQKTATEESEGPQKSMQVGKSAHRLSEQNKEAKPEAGSHRGGFKEPPANPALAAAGPQRNYDYLMVTASERQKTRILGAGRYRITGRVEGDPSAKDGWKILTIEELEILD